MATIDDTKALSAPAIQEYRARIPKSLLGLRLDRVLTTLFPKFSRAAMQRWIHAGAVTLDGNPAAASQPVAGGERVHLCVTVSDPPDWEAEAGVLQILYQDDDLLVLDKPADLVVHPGAGHANGTLINRLLLHQPRLRTVPRCGIVHRLDKDTTGLLVVATSVVAYTALCAALQQRQVRREYIAVADGIVGSSRTIEAPIGRDRHHRTRMAVVKDGRHAITHIRVREHFRAQSLLEVRLQSGRTHQIRVHLAHIGHPLLGDPIYNRQRQQRRQRLDPQLTQRISTYNRQALHAATLGFNHPLSGEPLHFISPLPADMTDLIEALGLDRDRARPKPVGGEANGLAC